MFALGRDGAHRLKEMGLPNMRSIVVLNMASQFRASRVTFKGWEDAWQVLVRAADQLPADTLLNGRLARLAKINSPFVRAFSAPPRASDATMGALFPGMWSRPLGTHSFKDSLLPFP